ncbi:hypothetical protein GWK76_03105 [Candidatus Saccharibacteria bacterium oral taxon 488]|nr:hypothetical protein GWK76_03105 [Candidatus Saccharibacteria bacterium oral taxon 488]
MFGMLIAGGVGVLGWWVSSTLIGSLGVVIASGAAATVVGLTAYCIPAVALSFSSHYRCWHRTAGAGLSLYNGLMGVIENPPTDPEFFIVTGRPRTSHHDRRGHRHRRIAW